MGNELTPRSPFNLYNGQAQKGLFLSKIYTLDDDFMITVTQQIENTEAIIQIFQIIFRFMGG